MQCTSCTVKPNLSPYRRNWEANTNGKLNEFVRIEFIGLWRVNCEFGWFEMMITHAPHLIYDVDKLKPILIISTNIFRCIFQTHWNVWFNSKVFDLCECAFDFRFHIIVLSFRFNHDHLFDVIGIFSENYDLIETVESKKRNHEREQTHCAVIYLNFDPSSHNVGGENSLTIDNDVTSDQFIIDFVTRSI